MIRQPAESKGHRLERIRRTLLAGGLLLLFLPSSVSGFSLSEEPGYHARQPFDSGSLIDVNLYNLNVVVKLPLSQTYPVNEHLSYGLTAFYNGAFQWTADPNGSYYGRSLNNPALHGWMGAGWRLDFGKLMNATFPDPPSSSCSLITSTWISPGGAHHPFTSSNLGATQDGSDMRIWQVAYPYSQYCPVPTRVEDRVRRWDLSFDPNTGRATRIEAANGISSHHVDIAYMEPADFLAVDPSADPESWNYDPPWEWIEERTFAIRQVSDTHGRIITTRMENIALDPNRSKFLLQEIHVPVFGDSPGSPTGLYTFHYEVRTITTAPDGWPPLVPGPASVSWPYLVRVELPADAAGNRLSYVFDYNLQGELVEIRNPAGGLTKLIWGNEYVNPDEPGIVETTPVRRVVVERQEYPDSYASPTLFYSWKYAHNPCPPSDGMNGSGPIYDTWRTIVTDPGGNDTEYRFYTTKDLSFAQRNFFYPRGGLGVMKYYKGQAKRWVLDAQSDDDVDPNFPGNGALLRGVYYRYEAQDPNGELVDPIHLEGALTVYYDDKLTTTPTPFDPTTTDSGIVAIWEMAFDLTPLTGPTRPFHVPEGFATHLLLHDPEVWRWGNFVGTMEYTTIHKGNLVGGHEIRFEGADVHCEVNGPFGQERKVYLDGTLVEHSQWGQPCIRRNDVSVVHTPEVLESRDVGFGTAGSNGFTTEIIHTGGDPDSTDPNATGNSGITYREVLTHQAGVLATKKYDGVSWFSLDRDIDVATGLTEVSRDPSGVSTAFGYDALGRMTQSAPLAPEHATSVAYPVGAGLGGLHKFSRSIETRTGPPGDPGELYSRQDFDGLGRVIRESRLRDDGGTILRDTTYDGLGAVTFQSEWYDSNAAAPHPGTTYDYNTWNFAFPPVGLRDPFSRPWKITDASGAVVKIIHFGLNESRIVTQLNRLPTDPPNGVYAQTDIYRDYRGNVRIVNAPEGADALYDYDASGRLTIARIVGSFTWKEYDPADPNAEGLRDNRFAVGDGGGQTRRRTYDALGRLRESEDPESGRTWYRAYDPMDRIMIFEEEPKDPNSNPRGRAERHSYDPAGRLAEVRATDDAGAGFAVPGNLRLRNTYANAAGSFPGHGQALSRLVRSETFEGPAEGLEVERELFYQGLGGRLSKERIRYQDWPRDPNQQPAAPWVSTSYLHDNYGQLQRLTYPVPEGSLRAPTEVEYTYSHGLLKSVRSNKATLDPNLFTDMATVGYDNRNLLDTLSFQNGVVEDWAADVLGRTESVTFKKGTNTLWSRVGHKYDGAGNLFKIGSLENFGYDTIGRLTSSATLSTDGTAYQQSYTYNAFGAMTWRTRYAGGPQDQQFTVSSATNRLTSLTMYENGTAVDSPRNFVYWEDGSTKSDGIYEYLHDDLNHLRHLRFTTSTDDFEAYSYDDRGLRLTKSERVNGRKTMFFRGPDGKTLSEYGVPYNAPFLEPHWKKDYIHAMGRHIAIVENLEPDEPTMDWSSVGCSSVSLYWHPVASPDVHGYRVYRSTGSPGGPFVDLTPATPYTEDWLDDYGTQCDQVYFYDVKSVDSAGVESRSNLWTVITDFENPPPVTNLQGEWLLNSVAIYWTKPAFTGYNDLRGYRVWRRTPPDPFEFLVLQPATSTGYMDSTVVQGTTYEYKVQSLDTTNVASSPNPTVTVVPDPNGGGGGGGGGGGCPPAGCPGGGGGALLLAPCRGGLSTEAVLAGLQSFCLPGELPVRLADHEETDYRIIFLHPDHLGTPRVITDEDGTVLSQHSFLPYGEEAPGLHSVWGSSNTHWFTGHERDELVIRDIMLARYYPVPIARFDSPDPAGCVTDRLPQDACCYAYAQNSPLRYVDPQGTTPFDVLQPLMDSFHRFNSRPLEPRIKPPVPKDDPQRLRACLEACRRGSAAISNFCRSIPHPAIRASCWAVSLAGPVACAGFCYLWFTL